MLRHIGQRIPVNPMVLYLNRTSGHALGMSMSTERSQDTIYYVESTEDNDQNEAKDALFSKRLRNREYEKTPSRPSSWLTEEPSATFNALQDFSDKKPPEKWRRVSKRPSRPPSQSRSSQPSFTTEEQNAIFADEAIIKGVGMKERGQRKSTMGDSRSSPMRGPGRGGQRGRQLEARQEQPAEVDFLSTGFEKGGMKRPSAAPKRAVGMRRRPKKGTSLYGEKEEEEDGENEDIMSEEGEFMDVDPEDMRLFRQLMTWRNPVTPDEPGKPALFQNVKTGYDLFAEARTEFRLNDYTGTVTLNGPTITPYIQIGGIGGDYDQLFPKEVQHLTSVDSATLPPLDAARLTLGLRPDVSQSQRESILATIDSVLSRSQARRPQSSA
ncbi:hypothetical protein FRC17_010276 [Serendipita sp. 399]|nr:hypothetical protein FRC17_010276 [Serendipita sp. 399]